MEAILSFSEYTGLDPLELGRAPNSGYGEVKGLRCHSVESGGATVLSTGLSITDSR
jgi:hypothetical protein